MQLDREAALKSASWGGPQIMGFNHHAAGYDTVKAFVAAMKTSERAHLQAFCSFIEKSGLVDELRMISNVHASCGPSAKGYNGKSYAANQYDVNIARAHSKFAAA